MDWSKFENLVTDDLKSEIADAASNNVEFKEVPVGTYEVSIEKMEAGVTKAMNPKLTVWFNILDGKFKNSKIFLNQVLTSGIGIHFANELMRSFGTDLKIEFESFSQYEKLINDVFEATSKYEYALDYGKNNKGFNTYKITQVYTK